jgi:hypothetical protein
MSAIVTRETRKVCTEDGTFPGAGIAERIGIPVWASILSTCSAPPPKSAGPAVRVSEGCPSVVEFVTVTARCEPLQWLLVDVFGGIQPPYLLSHR